MSNDLIIQTKNLCKSYGDIQAVNDLDLKVPENSIFGFLGPNGSGKSTTMKMLLNLIYPTSGKGEIFGLDIVKDSVRIRSQIGYLPQSPKFYDHMNVRQVLEVTAKFFQIKKNIKQKIDEALELVDMTERQNRPIKGLSGGERQRLGIAQALINSPKLLILDEPAAALDPIGRKKVLEIMSNLKERCTIFYSTHILDDVQRVSDQVAILNQGKLIAQGNIDDLLKQDKEEIYNIKIKGNKKKIQGILDKYTSEKDIKIIDFDSNKQNLEELFIKLVNNK